MTVVYLNGAFIPPEEARVAADDAAVLFGRGVYETFRARRGAVFRLDEHVRRLREGAALLGIAPPPELAALAEVIRELAKRCGLEDARMRLTLTAGAFNGRPSLLLQARPATDYPPELYRQGMTAITATVRRNETSPLSRIKSLNCLDNVMSRDQAQAAGAGTAILLNTQGLVAEASTANVFILCNRGLATPPVSDGALPGITRGVVLDLARKTGIAASERSLRPRELLEADEAFLTSAVMGVMPLISVDGRAIGTGQPGPLTQRLQRLYEAAASQATRRGGL